MTMNMNGFFILKKKNPKNKQKFIKVKNVLNN